MTNIELLILAVSLTFDTFAVSVGGGISMPNMKLSKKAMVMAPFQWRPVPRFMPIIRTM
jgi:putative Mn2+ efflux pump MntP